MNFMTPMPMPTPNDNDGWKIASVETCKKIGCFPNWLRYNESKATMALQIKRGSLGEFALSKPGLDYLTSTLANGQTDKGKPVTEAIVEYIDEDGNILGTAKATDLAKQQSTIRPKTGKFGVLVGASGGGG